MDLSPDQVRPIIERVTQELAARGVAVQGPGGFAGPALGQAPGMGRAVGRGYGSKAPAGGYLAQATGPGAPGSGAHTAGDTFPPLPDPERRANLGPEKPLGVFTTLDAAVDAAGEAHAALVGLPLSVRARCLEHVRAKLRANVRLLAEHAE